MLHVVYWVGLILGIVMFASSWVIRRQQITEGVLARAEKPLLLVGAGLSFVSALFGFTTLF